MIAVVTGASGFIGSHLVESLRADGVEVRALRRPGSAPLSLPAGVAAHTLDLAAADAGESSVWRDVTHVFHLAGRTRAIDPTDFVRANVTGTSNLVALLARRSTSPRMIHVSSQAAAGPAPSAESPLTDADVAKPVDAYGRSKHDAESVVHTSGLSWVIVRPAAVYGPRDRDFLQVFQQLGNPVALQASPSWHQLSLIHVHDLISALRTVATRDEALGRTFFVEDGSPTTWGRVYDDIGAVLRRSPPRLTVPAAVLRLAAVGSEFAAGLRGVDPLLTRAKLDLARHPYWLCAATALRTDLRWEPRITQARGWASTGEWYREARWIRA
jgi:nucleoside-diphosphate-sugar epimerase